jgi:hypothetical protein
VLLSRHGLCHCLSQVDWALDLSQSLGARHQPPDGGAPVAAAATPEPVGRRQHGWIRVLGDHAADHEPQQAAPRPHHIHAARPPPLVPTGVGGDNGIAHDKNWLRFTALGLRFYIFSIPLSPPTPVRASAWQLVSWQPAS